MTRAAFRDTAVAWGIVLTFVLAFVGLLLVIDIATSRQCRSVMYRDVHSPSEAAHMDSVGYCRLLVKGGW